MFGLSPSVFWIIAVIALCILEAATLGLTAIWFAIGALASAVVALLGAGWLMQVIVFLAVSAVSMFYTRPIVRDKLKVRNTPTNLDRIIGQTAIVTETIDNEKGKGQIKVNGLIWTARAENGEIIEKDTHVIVKSIQGVKAIVVPK
ncbi:MAG: NfeD family protein [Clostridia bacterium]|nr:NfeD family protein [Clostridia bacterium]